MSNHPRSPAAIREIGSVLLDASLEQIAKEEGVTRNQLLVLMRSDENLKERSKEYMLSALNFAGSKL